ncbi:MAG: helix-turn-helix domain-containing protein [Firmicutes bacterium]|nr:helix-turn-helix domain-containing protein [Bacillota bacterium]
MYQLMIVDDEPAPLDRLVSYVNLAGDDFHVMIKALGAEDALFYFQMAKPDLVITDIKMPVIDGLVLLEKMRAAGWDGYAAIVTGYDDFAYAQQAIRLNVFEYLLKPVFPEDIASLLKRAKELLDRDRAQIDKLRGEIRAELQREHTYQPEEGQIPSYITQSKDYIAKHYADPLTLAQVAKVVSVNPVYLSSRFTKYCGCTFLEYVTRYRIAKAKELLERTNLPIKEIAARVGYTDLAYFGRVFRRETGQTPSKYRTSVLSQMRIGHGETTCPRIYP